MACGENDFDTPGLKKHGSVRAEVFPEPTQNPQVAVGPST